MTQWDYLLTLQSVLSDCEHPDFGDSLTDGCELRWDSEADRLVAWGTPCWWSPVELVKTMIKKTRPYMRFSLARCSDGDKDEYGLHIHVRRGTVLSMFPETEIALARVLCVWHDNLTYSYGDAPMIDPMGSVFRPGRRACTKKLTSQQQFALNWMRANESMTSAPRAVCVDIPMGDHVYSFYHNMFMPVDRAQYDYMYLNAGALTGHRGTGKTLIARHLVKQPIEGTTTFPFYAYKTSLIVVPAHLVTHWKEAIDDSTVVDSMDVARTWVRVDPPTPVIITYDVLSELSKHTRSMFSNYITVNIAKRTQTLEIAPDTLEWDRVIFDELGSADMSTREVSAKFKWVFQAGLSSLQELNMVKSMYSTHTVSADLMNKVVYSRLPCVCPIQMLVNRVHQVELSEDNAGMNSGNVYSDSVAFETRHCKKWSDVKVSDELEEEEEVEEVADADSEDAFYGTGWLDTPSVLGPLIESLGIMGMDTLGVDDGEESVESEVVDVSDEFFMAQVHKADTPAVCSVCMDMACDSMFRCGHMFCYTCACGVMNMDTPRCPQCRYHVSTVITTREKTIPATYTVLLDLLRSLPVNETIVMGTDTDGVDHVAEFIHSYLPNVRFMYTNETVGRVETDVRNVVMLDDTASVPVTFSHPGRVIECHMFKMVASPGCEK